MWQKVVEARETPWKGINSSSHGKDLLNEFDPLLNTSFSNSLNLSFSEHVHHFIASLSSSGSVEVAEFHPWLD